jgi:hypothetical protein
MEKFYYTGESAIIADARADALMIAHDEGFMTNRQYCDECMNIVIDLLRLDISKKSTKDNWVKERMLKEEKRRKKKVNNYRHLSFVYKPTRLNTI